MRKQVQIPIEVFLQLIRYHLLEDEDADEAFIRRALEEKLDALVRHDQYTTYKTADDPAKREEAS